MEVRLVALALVLVEPTFAIGCGTSAVDVDGCRQIEEARCRQAPACGMNLDELNVASGTTVDACIRFYDIACLHGLAASNPGPSAVNACVAAIEADTKTKDNCSVVRSPQTDVAACGWLVPPPPTGPDASDAPSEATADSAME